MPADKVGELKGMFEVGAIHLGVGFEEQCFPKDFTHDRWREFLQQDLDLASHIVVYASIPTNYQAQDRARAAGLEIPASGPAIVADALNAAGCNIQYYDFRLEPARVRPREDQLYLRGVAIGQRLPDLFRLDVLKDLLARGAQRHCPDFEAEAWVKVYDLALNSASPDSEWWYPA